MQTRCSHLALVFLLMSALYSCKKSGDSDFDYSTIPTSIKMKGEVFIDSMMAPRSLTLFGSKLISIENRGKHRLKVYDTETGQELQTLLRSGRGVHELLQPWTLSIRDDTCWVFGGMSKKVIGLCTTELDSLVFVRELTVDERNSTQVFAGTEGGFFGTGISDSLKLFTAYNYNGKVTKAFASFPDLVPRDDSKVLEDALFYSTVYQGKVGISFKPKRITYAYSRFNVIDVFDFGGELLKRINGPEEIKVKVNRISPREGTLIFDAQPKYLAYRQIKTGRKEIWASHSGHILTRENYRQTVPRKIYCFSWDGEIIRELIFDIAINDFVVDWENKRLYCLSEKDFQPCIYMFSIDDLI